ncbi:hypothetical protein CEE37_15010 [candidate division LCP-89 bacterium B3_LCP]|uniref:Uncharacterized protein n=1 Tax=candidate division LCP-89 bacterium B3_LCP TaxID=2012998 RepID=A0A532UP40_UNCL8|nr:MAG: hypothetical protein CEE37_15010 [candidate division LCP-89 bacterium B3_LCP]
MMNPLKKTELMELSIRFTSDEKKEDSPIEVSFFQPQNGTYSKSEIFDPPLDDEHLAELRWYLEEFSNWFTLTDYERAERLKAQLEDWGRDLLRSVTKGHEAIRIWQQFVDDKEKNKLLTIDATDPRVLRLPWELLADEQGHIFTDGVSIRRRLQKVARTVLKPLDLPVRVLIVVSRPNEKDVGFFDPRADSKPLLDAVDTLGDMAQVEFLYPPTLRALTDRLRDTHAPRVHVVHFDGHGVYNVGKGLGYLLFEDDEHKKDLIDASQLGTLLTNCGVPLMVLSACQSAKQEEANPYASVAARLIRAGVGSVLAMNYSVLVTAATKFVEAFYGSLVKGLSVGQSVDEGRYALHSDERRYTITRHTEDGDLVEETVKLRDWHLPALYQQATDPVVFKSRKGAKRSEPKPKPLALTDHRVAGGLPKEPLHGFHGRAQELHKIQRALAERNVVVLHGFGGIGKTALAAEAGRWFYRTGRFPGGAAFVSFEHGGSLQQLCSWVGQAVSNDPNFAIGEGDPVERVADVLKENPALIILDNFESVLGKDPMMPPDELEEILDAVWKWAETDTSEARDKSSVITPPRTRILITTRDTNFNDSRFSPSKECAHIELGGLIQSEALNLAAAVLNSKSIDRAEIDLQELIYLMDLLGGHPLSLYLTLPHLHDYSPAELTAQFEELLPDFIEGEARDRNESLTLSLEFSLNRMGEETRAALPNLAVFQGAAFEEEILQITQIDPELWKTARAEMEQASLVSVESLPGINPPFLRFHPTLIPYLSSRLPSEHRSELEERYWKRYYALSNYLYQTDTQNPHMARTMAWQEMPNLLCALDLAVAARDDEASVNFATCIEFFLNAFGRWRERDRMMERVATTFNTKEADILTQAEFMLLSQQGETLWQQGRALEAEKIFRNLLKRLETNTAYDSAYDHARTLWSLGRCFTSQGKPGEATDWHKRALQEFKLLSESNEDVKNALGTIYCDLGNNLTIMGKYDEAQKAYESGLDISKEVDDMRAVGVTLGQMGSLALNRGNLAEAVKQLTEALQTFRSLGEPKSEAAVWHQLGMVAGKAENWEEAERCYRESLKLEEKLNNPEGIAITCNQLANVAQSAGRFNDAERWFLRALDGFEKTEQFNNISRVLSNLANLCLSLSRLDEAEDYAMRALEIDEHIDDPSTEIWKNYSIIAEITEKRGETQEAAKWRRKEKESYAAYAGSAHEIEQFQPLINAVVQAVKGDEKVRAFVESEYPKMQAGDPEWQLSAEAIRRIIAGERGVEVLTEGMGRKQALIISTILALLQERQE